jgi:hypothetical protein
MRRRIARLGDRLTAVRRTGGAATKPATPVQPNPLASNLLAAYQAAHIAPSWPSYLALLYGVGGRHGSGREQIAAAGRGRRP